MADVPYRFERTAEAAALHERWAAGVDSVGSHTLANALAPHAKLEELATGAACIMDFDVSAWSAVSAGSAQSAERKGRAPRLFGLLK